MALPWVRTDKHFPADLEVWPLSCQFHYLHLQPHPLKQGAPQWSPILGSPSVI